MTPSSSFPRRRFGRPQVIAVLLLLAFAGQCLWVMSRLPMSTLELLTVRQGRTQLRSGEVIESVERSPLVPLLAAAPTLGRADSNLSQERTGEPSSHGGTAYENDWRWRARVPFLVLGGLLGASVWYVARRLYGDAGGYIALTLYSFSPAIIQHSATVHPEIAAAWGTFGCIFTGIAVAHTLYAPREVVLWNWKRITLLGVAIGLGVAAQFAVAIAILIALAFMFYLVPERRGAALAIMGTACAMGLLVLWASYGFHSYEMFQSVRGARLAGLRPAQLSTGTWLRLLGSFFVRNSPGVVLLGVIALVTYAAWPRTRFFGVTAPLLVSVILLALAFVLPHISGPGFLVVALPFVFVFIAGVFVDLLESRQSGLVLGVLTAVLLSHALFSLAGLWQLAIR